MPAAKSAIRKMPSRKTSRKPARKAAKKAAKKPARKTAKKPAPKKTKKRAKKAAPAPMMEMGDLSGGASGLGEVSEPGLPKLF